MVNASPASGWERQMPAMQKIGSSALVNSHLSFRFFAEFLGR
jgi:hypothetical protein